MVLKANLLTEENSVLFVNETNSNGSVCPLPCFYTDQICILLNVSSLRTNANSIADTVFKHCNEKSVFVEEIFLFTLHSRYLFCYPLYPYLAYFFQVSLSNRNIRASSEQRQFVVVHGVYDKAFPDFSIPLFFLEE